MKLSLPVQREILDLLSEQHSLFEADIERCGQELEQAVGKGRFLVIGGAGSIGRAVVRELFRRKPSALHVVDLSENNLVELVRDLRSSLGYFNGDFRTFALDAVSPVFDAMFHREGPYDYVLNLAAMKHVRSEKDPYTLMRLLEVNILGTMKTVDLAAAAGARKYFSVSTDKAAAPASLMGASKRVMELALMRNNLAVPVSTARFANVAFSDGSLLHGFTQRLRNGQPISAPLDIQRYFVTQREAGELCLLSCLQGQARDIFFPKESEKMRLTYLHEIAVSFVETQGYEPFLCESEEEARTRAADLIATQKWPCYFFASDTSGEKPYEEFYLPGDSLDLARFESIGVINHPEFTDKASLDLLVGKLEALRHGGQWSKSDIVSLLQALVPELHHIETGQNLDNRM